MITPIKKAEDLTPTDLDAFPVWEYMNTDDDLGETVVRPVKKIPVANLDGCLVGTHVRLANGAKVPALLCNVDSNNPEATQHFLTLSVFNKGKSFDLARYHDVDSTEHGPQALATFLLLPLDEIFPISYDLRSLSIGSPTALAGTIEKEPPKRLTRTQLMKLALR